MRNISNEKNNFYLTNPYVVKKTNIDPRNPSTHYFFGISLQINPFMGMLDTLKNYLLRAQQTLETNLISPTVYQEDDFDAFVGITYYSINFGFMNLDISDISIVLDDTVNIPIAVKNYEKNLEQGSIKNVYAEAFTEYFECNIRIHDLKKIAKSNNAHLLIRNANGIVKVEFDSSFKLDIATLINLSMDSAFREDDIIGGQETVDQEHCFVYVMQDTVNSYYKIGISKKPEWRERTLQSQKPTIELIAAKKFVSRRMASSFEKALHETYLIKRIRGEWFNLDYSEVKEIEATLND